MSALNVHAFRTATATETTAITIDTTQNAALAISSSVLGAYNNGMLSVDLSRGGKVLQMATGTLAADSIKMRKVFQVTNLSTTCSYYVSAYVPSGGIPNLSAIYGRDASNATSVQLASSGGTQLQPLSPNLWYTLGTSGVMYVDFWWDASTQVSATGFNVRVTSQLRSCP